MSDNQEVIDRINEEIEAYQQALARLQPLTEDASQTHRFQLADPIVLAIKKAIVELEHKRAQWQHIEDNPPPDNWTSAKKY